jgi:hypothetical protein
MHKEVDAITQLYDFILWIIPKIDKFPRNRRFVLGDRIEVLALEILELLIEAAYSRRKAEQLRTANLNLEKLRYLIRIAKDLQVLNLKSYGHAAKLIDGVGRSIGGWIKYIRNEKPQSTI